MGRTQVGSDGLNRISTALYALKHMTSKDLDRIFAGFNWTFTAFELVSMEKKRLIPFVADPNYSGPTLACPDLIGQTCVVAGLYVGAVRSAAMVWRISGNQSFALA